MSQGVGTEMLQPYRISSRTGFRVVQWKRKIRRSVSYVCKGFSVSSQNLETNFRASRKSWFRLVKICSGIMTQAPFHRAGTNGVAEMAVHRVKEGTAVALAQQWTQRLRQDGRQQDTLSNTLCQRIWRTAHSFRNIGWIRSDHRERQVKDTPVWKENADRMIVGLCTTYGKNKVGLATHGFAHFEDVQETEATTKKVNKQFLNHKEVFVKDPYVFPCFKREIEVSWSTRTVTSALAEGNFQQHDDDEIAEGDTNFNKRFPVRAWWFHLPTPWRTEIGAVHSRKWSTPESIKVRCCDEVDAFNYRQYLGDRHPRHLDRGDGRQSFWGLDWDFQISDLTDKTWRIHMGQWEACEDPENYQTRQYLPRSLDAVLQEQQQKDIADWAEENAKLQAARRNANLRRIDRLKCDIGLGPAAFDYERRQQRCWLSILSSRSHVACWAALRPQSFKLVAENGVTVSGGDAESIKSRRSRRQVSFAHVLRRVSCEQQLDPQCVSSVWGNLNVSGMRLWSLLLLSPRAAPMERGSLRSRAVLRLSRVVPFFCSQLWEVSKSLCARSSCEAHIWRLITSIHGSRKNQHFPTIFNSHGNGALIMLRCTHPDFGQWRGSCCIPGDPQSSQVTWRNSSGIGGKWHKWSADKIGPRRTACQHK